MLRESLLGLRAPLRTNQQVHFAPGGQFWVARARILARPRSFYAALYDAVTDPTHPQLGEGRRSSIDLYSKRPGLGVFFMEVGLAQWNHASTCNPAPNSVSSPCPCPHPPTRRTGT